MIRAICIGSDKHFTDFEYHHGYFKSVFSTRMRAHGMRRSLADPKLFVGVHGELMPTHVDDVLCAASPEHFDEVLVSMKKEVKIKIGPRMSSTWITCLGRE